MLNCIMRWTLLAMAAVLARGADDYAAQIEQFRAAREADLKADDGWLTVVGLHWLKDGANRVGSGLGSDVPLPAAAPSKVGVITLSHGSASFTPEPGAHVTLNGQHTRAALVKPNTDIFATGRVKFFLIQRPDGLAVRVKDNDSGARREFTHLNWFPVDPSWRFEARYTAFEQPETLLLDTLAGGRQQHSSPGYVTFQKDGRDYRLDPVLEGERLFFVIRDQTSGKSTYGGARFVYADLPKDGLVTLDFNQAINPPCVFTAHATCPLPPPQNRLPIAVTAGEMMYGEH
jgi:uncharacterized protein (DUF1684 family)